MDIFPKIYAIFCSTHQLLYVLFFVFKQDEYFSPLHPISSQFFYGMIFQYKPHYCSSQHIVSSGGGEATPYFISMPAKLSDRISPGK